MVTPCFVSAVGVTLAFKYGGNLKSVSLTEASGLESRPFSQENWEPENASTIHTLLPQPGKSGVLQLPVLFNFSKTQQ